MTTTTRIYGMICAAAIVLSFSGWASCAHVTPVVTAEVSCSGRTIPTATVQRFYSDLMTENWTDLAMTVIPALPNVWADAECIISDLEQSNPEVRDHAAKFRASHRGDLRGSTVSLHSPGEARPPESPAPRHLTDLDKALLLRLVADKSKILITPKRYGCKFVILGSSAGDVCVREDGTTRSLTEDDRMELALVDWGQ